MKNGFSISGAITPMILDDFLNRERATSLGLKPVSEIAFKTLCIFSSSTFAVPFITLDTVEGETPASFATSRILVIPRHLLSLCIFSFETRFKMALLYHFHN